MQAALNKLCLVLFEIFPVCDLSISFSLSNAAQAKPILQLTSLSGKLSSLMYEPRYLNSSTLFMGLSFSFRFSGGSPDGRLRRI